MQLSSLLWGIPSVVLCPTKWRDLKEEGSLVIFKAYSYWAVMESDYILIRLSASQTICLPGCFHHILPSFFFFVLSLIHPFNKYSSASVDWRAQNVLVEFKKDLRRCGFSFLGNQKDNWTENSWVCIMDWTWETPLNTWLKHKQT